MRINLCGACALFACLLVLSACGEKNPSTDNATPAPKVEKGNPPAGLNIRYIDADSIAAKYKLAQVFQEQTLATVSRIESTGQSRQSQIQQLASQIDQKTRNNGYLSQESYEADMQRLNKMQQDAAQTLDRMQRQAQTEMAQRQAEMNDSLENFIKIYNARHGFDAILFKAAGVYFNPALDITDEVVAGLNARYEAGKKNR